MAKEASAILARRMLLQSRSPRQKWQALVSLLSVAHLSPNNQDDLFELYCLVLTLDVLENELGLPAPAEAGLVVPGRSYVARYALEWGEVRVYFDQSGPLRAAESAYLRIAKGHTRLGVARRRPDIVVEARSRGGQSRRTLLVEAKRSLSAEYLSDSVYKVLGYLQDFAGSWGAGQRPQAIMLIPGEIAAIPRGRGHFELEIVGAGDRGRFAECIAESLELA